MGVRLDFQLVAEKFPKLKEISLEQAKADRKMREQIFDRVIFQSTNVSDIEDVSTEDLVGMLSEIGTYFGEPLPHEVERGKIAENVLNADGMGHIRVL